MPAFFLWFEYRGGGGTVIRVMAERFSGNAPYPRRGQYGSNRRGLVGHVAPTGLEIHRNKQSLLDKQKQIELFRRPHPEILETKRIDLGNKELAAYKKKHEFQKSVRENKVTKD